MPQRKVICLKIVLFLSELMVLGGMITYTWYYVAYWKLNYTKQNSMLKTSNIFLDTTGS